MSIVHSPSLSQEREMLTNTLSLSGKPFSFPADIDEMLTNTMSELTNTFFALSNTANNLNMHIAGK